jgi:accessory gene regulator protein AgrB
MSLLLFCSSIFLYKILRSDYWLHFHTFPVLKLVKFNYAARSTVNVHNSHTARKKCVNAWMKIAYDILEYNRDPHIRKT